MTINALTTFPSLSRLSTFEKDTDQFYSELELFQQQLNDYGNAFALGVTSSSVTSLTLGIGTFNLTVDPDKGYAPGMDVVVASTAMPTKRMYGTVTSYNKTTGALVFEAYNNSGVGTFNSWSITMTAAVDAAQFATLTGAQTLSNKTLESPQMTGNPTAPTQAIGVNNTTVATTAYVYAERYNAYTITNKTINWSNNTMQLTSGQLLAALANKTGTGLAVFNDSPSFSGTPTVPTANPGTNTTQAASCSFVMAAVGGYAPLASPAFTGTPTAPTPALNTNTTQLATAEFVMSQFANGLLAAGRYKFTAQGAISKGDVVSLNSNGTVTKVSALAGIGTIGAKAAFNAVNPTVILKVESVPGTNTVIILYNENGSIKLVAGTINGGTTNTYTIGAPIAAPANTAATSFSMTWNVTENVLVLTYINTTMFAVTVGLSGTTLTLNAPNNSGITPQTAYTCCEYNTAQNKTVVAYVASTALYVLSLTISGAAFAWGAGLYCAAGNLQNYASSAVQLAGTSTVAVCWSNGSSSTVPYVTIVSVNAATCTLVQHFATTSYFSTSNQIIKVGYHQAAGFLFVGSNLSGAGFIGKTSGGTMTNLAAATFTGMSRIHSFSYDSVKNNLVVMGLDASQYAVAANISIVSNASVTTGLTVINGTASATVAGSYNASQDRMCIAFQDLGNLNYGTSRVWQTGTTSADQWVGIAQAAIADTASGWIWTIGGYCDALTGLTVGASYYLDDSGNLQTSGTRLIGVAHASNRLFITGKAA